MLKSIMRGFAAGAAFMGAVLAIGLLVVGLRAATLTPFSPPGSGQQISFPAAQADLNYLINWLNSYLAPAGTGTVVSALGITTGTSTNTGGPQATGLIQLMQVLFETTTTSTLCGGMTGANVAFAILDASSTERYLCLH